MSISLGGFYYRNLNRIQFPHIECPKESDLNDFLKKIENESGIIVLEQESLNEVGPNTLTLYSENRRYSLTYGCYQEDGDYLVLTLTDNNETKKGKLASILGEPFPATSVVEDFSSVKKVFIDFLSTGKPGKELK